MLKLAGSCRCGAVRFSMQSHAPHPYQLCYCTICRKTAGGGGFAINLSAAADSLDVKGRAALRVYRADLATKRAASTPAPANEISAENAVRALAVRSDLAGSHPSIRIRHRHVTPDASVSHAHHAAFKASWVEPDIGPNDQTFDDYPDMSIEEWHRAKASLAGLTNSRPLKAFAVLPFQPFTR